MEMGNENHQVCKNEKKEKTFLSLKKKKKVNYIMVRYSLNGQFNFP